MSGQSNYLPAGLPHNRALWPAEYQEKISLICLYGFML